MYNSYLVGFLVKLWNLVESSYENSILKKIVDNIRRFFIFIFKHSVVKSIIADEKDILPNTLLYKIYKFLVNLYNKILIFLNENIKKLGSGSFFFATVKKYFVNDETAVSTLVRTLRFLFVGILFVNIFIKKNIYISLMCVILIITLSNKFYENMKTSNIYKLVEDILSVDEGGDQWW